MSETQAGHPPRQVRVTTTTRLSPETPILVLRDGLPYTVIVVREGTLYKEFAPLWDNGRLTPDELQAWVTAWGVPVDANPWDYVDPDRPSHRDDIPAALRLPTEMEEFLLELV